MSVSINIKPGGDFTTTNSDYRESNVIERSADDALEDGNFSSSDLEDESNVTSNQAVSLMIVFVLYVLVGSLMLVSKIVTLIVTDSIIFSQVMSRI